MYISAVLWMILRLLDILYCRWTYPYRLIKCTPAEDSATLVLRFTLISTLLSSTIPIVAL